MNENEYTLKARELENEALKLGLISRRLAPSTFAQTRAYLKQMYEVELPTFRPTAHFYWRKYQEKINQDWLDDDEENHMEKSKYAEELPIEDLPADLYFIRFKEIFQSEYGPDEINLVAEGSEAIRTANIVAEMAHKTISDISIKKRIFTNKLRYSPTGRVIRQPTKIIITIRRELTVRPRLHRDYINF